MQLTGIPALGAEGRVAELRCSHGLRKFDAVRVDAPGSNQVTGVIAVVGVDAAPPSEVPLLVGGVCMYPVLG